MSALLIGHRGLAALAPENTLAAIRAAQAQGLGWLELDVQLSQDGQPVIFHDDRLERTTNGQGRLQQHRWPSLQRLDAGSWFGPQFRGEPIPSLEQALALIAELGLSLNLEFKSQGPADALIAACAPGLRAHPGEIWLSSFEPSIWPLCRQTLPEFCCHALYEQLPDGRERQRLAALGIRHLAVEDRLWQPEWQQSLEATWQVGVFTVNQPDRAQFLSDYGIDWLFSDRPLPGLRRR